MKVLVLILILVLLSGCASAPVKGCGYARSNQKKMDRYKKHVRHQKAIHRIIR
jgi:uncharacterized protein YceK